LRANGAREYAPDDKLSEAIRKPHQELDCFVASHSELDSQDQNMSVTTLPSGNLALPQPGWLARLFDYKPLLIVICLTPAIGLLLVFLTYPLGLGVWLAFTDTTIGRRGVFVGLENFQYLLSDPLWWNAVFYSVFYTAVATFGKFALGFWLALLLNNHFPFKNILRAIVLLPWIVPTVLSALAFWWIYDPQFSIISYLLVDVLHVRSSNVDFLGSPWPARFSLIAANIWRGIPFVAISLLAGLQTISPSLYEAAMLDGATAWQRFRYITFPMMLPILAIVMTFSIIFTFTDFQLVYAITRGGPVNSTHLLATLAFQRGIAGGELGEGAAIAVSMIPFLVFATLFSYFGLARRKWQQGESND
jgi:multiple sugar transport system permease protein